MEIVRCAQCILKRANILSALRCMSIPLLLYAFSYSFFSLIARSAPRRLRNPSGRQDVYEAQRQGAQKCIQRQRRLQSDLIG